MKKGCCVFNVAPHYRENIYKKIDETFSCDFFIGDRNNTLIKKMNYNELKGFKGLLLYRHIRNHFYWLSGQLRLLFKPYLYYVITGDFYCLSNYLFLFTCFLFRKKVYLWTHGWYGRENRFKKIVKKIYLGMSSGVLLYGDYAKNCMIREGFNPKKLFCIYNSLNYDFHLFIRKQLYRTCVYSNYFGNDAPVLLYVGRIQKIKKIDLLIKAIFYLSLKYDYEVNLVLVGENIDDFGIEPLINAYSLESKVWLYGECFDEFKLGELFYNADVCVSPGNVGLTAIHSLSFGCPVITHNNLENQMPEFEAIKAHLTGDFFCEDDLDSLIKVIINWLENNPVKSELCIKECYRVVDERYNPNYQISVLKSVIDDI